MDFGFFAPWQTLTFFVCSVLFFLISRKQLKNPHCHGFYRFFAFESILVILLLNLPFWHDNLLAPYQLISWMILGTSIFFVLNGLMQLKRHGGQQRRAQEENFAFENTEKLVTSGIFRFIRHPMYAALLFLAWGGLLKYLTLIGLLAAITASLALFLTGLVEERENLSFFGDEYRTYMQRSKRFIPFLF